MIDYRSTKEEVVVIISDLHSNKNALKASFEEIYNNRCDQLIILGDVLSYGIDVEEVVDMVSDAVSKGAWLILGNHDKIYLDLIDGYCDFFKSMQPYIQESIDYNFKKLNVKQFKSLPWKKEIIYNNVFYSHANPYNNLYDYIKTDNDFENAAQKINNMGNIAGVFGHTHRCKEYASFIDSKNIFILNPGSIGQPRIKPQRSTMMRLFSHNNKISSQIETIVYDINKHIDGLTHSSLSEKAKIKLISFF